ncbi:hybrid sensor histidine kinase/response regulator [Pseudoalteromonas sp. 13-15]|jgi:two-component system sensor histidine kinase/response regulator|nr:MULTISPECIES: response regulator [Pseudoalteromonas]MBL1385374.1 response regulator [Colwellia sp.]AUL73586.1 hybrid sensor histidine kinase/response regulator [Pseudoalteromonas sp. 13-15]MDP2487083.1 response regulator [Pseudoalteromonas marina]UOB72968.1 response regulator [Pseudoalteromonas sp. APM04]SIN90156.1 Response regulator receiver domain-containing protein [Pseudoalteromonas marina]
MLDKVTQLLLVEDDEDDYILTCDYLEQLDSHTFNVQWVSSPEQAIETLSKNEHDICLLDYRLGASNGLDVLKEAIANGFSGPIIMLTGQSDDELDSAALDAGAVDYLIKGEMSSSRFARAIRYALARKDVEGERVERLKAEAENRSKDRFLAHLSHELRTPLSSILGYTELLMQSDFSQQAENELGVIYRNGKHLLSLLNDVLDLSKIAADKLELTPSEVNLDSMLADVYTLMRVSVLDKGLALKFESDQALPLVARLDATRVRQILINLINNAVKFTDKGEIVVKAWTQHVDGTEMLFFSIKDSGMGIAPEKQQLIFKPFEQIADVESRSVGGAGLGLAICAELLSRMQGNISLHSEIGKGSTFTISVYPGDISDVERQVLNFSSAPQLQSKLTPSKVHGRVLVVDDLRDLRMLVGHMISSCGARVDYAEHGQQALEKVRIADAYKAPYDIIFIDIHMPIMGGKEATIELRKMGYKGPIIALTAATMKGIHEELAALGFNDVIPKPVDSSALYQCLQDYLVSPENAPQAKDIQVKALSEKRQRFLLVEDDDDAAQITQLLLESLGVETVIASSCAQCLQILNHDQQFDKVLLDMHLPDGSGIDLGEQVNERYPELRLVIVSGAEPDPKEIKDLNIDRVLLKPINLGLLETLIS